MNLKINTDGGARGNPGPAACAYVVYELGPSTSSGLPAANLREKRGKYLGHATNNVAEYQGVLTALSYLRNLSGLDKADFYLDSQLVVNQINGLWKTKDSELKVLNAQIKELIKGFVVNFYYVPREQNTEADKLVNDTLDNL